MKIMKPISNRDAHTKQEEPLMQISPLAIPAFGALIGLTIVIITQLKIYDFNTITVLLILMFLVLIYGFWGISIRRNIKIYQEERRQNKLANIHFKKFKELVFQFKEFTVDSNVGNIQCIIENLKNTSGIPEFSQLNVVSSSFIQDSYKYYTMHIEAFNKINKVGLRALAEQFESILNMYFFLYVKESTKNIKIIKKEFPQMYKEQYNNARLKYIGFREDYIKFAKVANEDLFNEGDLRKLKDYFEYPEEL